MRVVLDTNVLIDSANDELSASSRLLEHVAKGNVEAIATPAVLKEYRRISQRLLVKTGDKERIENVLSTLISVSSQPVDVLIDDKEDLKFIEAAVGGDAEAVVTSDRHLLDIGSIAGVRMIRPQEAMNIIEEEHGGNTWQSIIKNLGIT